MIDGCAPREPDRAARLEFSLREKFVTPVFIADRLLHHTQSVILSNHRRTDYAPDCVSIALTHDRRSLSCACRPIAMVQESATRLVYDRRKMDPKDIPELPNAVRRLPHMGQTK